MKVDWTATTDRQPPDRAICWVVLVIGDTRTVWEATYYDGLRYPWLDRDGDPIGDNTDVTYWAPYVMPDPPPLWPHAASK